MNKDKCFDSIQRGTRSLSHLFEWNFNFYYFNVWTRASNHRFPRMFNFLPEKVLLFVSPSCLPSRPHFPSLYGHLRISSWVKNNSKIDPSLETVSDYSSLYRFIQVYISTTIPPHLCGYKGEIHGHLDSPLGLDCGQKKGAYLYTMNTIDGVQTKIIWKLQNRMWDIGENMLKHTFVQPIWTDF